MMAVSLLESDGHLAAALASEGVLRAALARRLDRTEPTASTVTAMVADLCQIAEAEPDAVDRFVRVRRPNPSENQSVVPGPALPRAVETTIASPTAMLRSTRSG